EKQGKRLVVDPYMSNHIEALKGIRRLAAFPLRLEQLKPDVLLCTHDHLDHLDPVTVQLVAAACPRCRFAGSAGSYRHFMELGVAEARCVLLEIGSRVKLAGFEVVPVFARHSDPDAIGLVLADGTDRIYLSGDTEFDERLFDGLRNRRLNTVLICINGKLGNMNIDEALQVVKILKPQMALPMHYGLFAENTVDPQPFVAGCGNLKIKSFLMIPGNEFNTGLHSKFDQDL
ncbi:MAG: MBL fold metallo-hydrolase, partial [Victivallales bacterium]|nr:MBL fold metallo-hydrolase [Victivallales bacterium]